MDVVHLHPRPNGYCFNKTEIKSTARTRRVSSVFQIPKMLDIQDNTIPENTLTERVSIFRQNSYRNDKRYIANDIIILSVNKTSAETISAGCYFKRMPSKLSVSCYLRNFVFQVKLVCDGLLLSRRHSSN